MAQRHAIDSAGGLAVGTAVALSYCATAVVVRRGGVAWCGVVWCGVAPRGGTELLLLRWRGVGWCGTDLSVG
jgi:hypothetical protein